ncbi:MAG: glycosyltransferase family 2 protein [Thermoanaerobaculia bacterium]|nr:glycosyltransferase family 2 protein [Thermoanaerobaculia bacterium]
MKVIIQIPCLNEAKTLPATLAALPRELPGVDSVEWLVIDDGSTDDTAAVARAHGVDHVVPMNGNQGLARAFTAGLLAAAELAADVIVNTDADNQYQADDIEKIVAPIVAGEADMVIGSRPIQAIRHFSPLKRFLQRLGSRVVRTVSGTEVRDAPSGFRAFTADAALRLNVFSSYTYTLETIIQAGSANLRIVDVPIRVNGPTRPSRLIRSIPSYLRRSVVDILKTYVIYHPVRIFGLLGALFLIPAAFLATRYLVYVALGEGTGHVQSVVASGVLAICGVFMLAIGIVAHLQGVNRQLLEETRYLLHSERLRPRLSAEDRRETAETSSG